MEEASKKQFGIHLPGLLKVLAENLYSSKKVAIRELIQNAHDSCIRRSVEAEGDTVSYHPRVDIWADPNRGTLTIRDNGSGLTAADLTNYLSTIGRSYTRELGERLDVLSTQQASRLIGQFGLGFLSAFLIASKVTLTTRSIHEAGVAWRWHSTGDIHYEIGPGQREEYGTTVELLLKPNASFLFNEAVLAATVRQYADFLPIPIYVYPQNLIANLMTPPWLAQDSESEIHQYIERRFHLEDPLWVLPLSDYTLKLNFDGLKIPLEGFLFIPPNSIASVREYGDLDVYIRRMFICEGQKELLPPWARFIRGVIDCPYLQPTASREEIHQEDNFALVQRALENLLLSNLKRLAENEPLVWKKIIQAHSDLITGWAIQDQEFFESVADLVAFRTTQGLLNLQEYLRLTGGDTIYYLSKELGSLQDQLLGEGEGLPVIDASWFAVIPFLQKYATSRRKIHLVQMDGEAQQLLRPAARQLKFEGLLAFYREKGIRTKLVSFNPPEVPGLMTYPKDAEFLLDSRRALESNELAEPLQGLVGNYVQGLERQNKSKGQELKGILNLNAACPLLDRLAALAPDDPSRAACLTVIYQLARLFSGRNLTTTDVKAAFAETSKALEEMI
jgi:molecular chaperone HtpG